MSEHMSAEADPTAGERPCPDCGQKRATHAVVSVCPATPDAGDASERCPDCGHDQDLHYALGHTGCHDIASRCDCKRVPASTSASEPLTDLLDRVDWMDLWWQMTGDDWPVPDDFPRKFARIVADRLGLAAREAKARAEAGEQIAPAIEAEAREPKAVNPSPALRMWSEYFARIAREVTR